jgi:thiol-disulfide isomerase/thioredoxin
MFNKLPFKQSHLPYVLFVVGVLLIFVWARSVKYEGFENNGLEASYVTANPYKFHMYYVDWCPHCHAAKPEFDKLEPKMTIGGQSVICEAVNAEKNPEKVLGKPEGYPTVELYNAEGKLVKTYEGERTAAGFRSFLEDALNRPAARS